jgi:UDPglucose 6-dehydrogenase
MKVGIYGYGFVGQATHMLMMINPVIYDLKEPYNTLEQFSEIMKTDLLFLCVPTPMNHDGLFDDSIITASLDKLIDKGYKGVVVVKSTTLFRVLQPYQDKLNILFNPEFLNQNTNFEDVLKQEVIIIGGDVIHTKILVCFYDNFCNFKSKYEYQFTTMKQACDFKYIRNIYGAYKVLFWEFVQDTTLNSRKMAQLYDKVPYNNESSQIGMDGFRGFGGECWPKDVAAWDNEHGHNLTQFMTEFNSDLEQDD